MVDIPFSVVNSFTSNAFEGNPAAVILNANTLDHETMLRIARQFHLVETTFVLSAPQNSDFDFELRYFTPTEEVSLAIHPTIAALVSLNQEGYLDSHTTTCILKTKSGNRHVDINKYKTSFLVEAVPPKFYPVLDNRSAVANVFGLDENDLLTNLPIQPVDTGLGHLIVPVTSLNALMKAKRNISALEELCFNAGVREAQLFTFDVYNNKCDVHTRNICPREGIEDPGCGVGNAALGAYLFKHREDNKSELFIQAEQGIINSMPCVIHTHVFHEKDGIRVRVGGTGKTMMTGTLKI